MTLVLRTTSDPRRLVPAIRERVREIDRDQPVAGIATMEELLGEALAQPRFGMLLLGIFAAVALTLAAVGLYGVIAYGVNRRTREIGIRTALGASSKDVLRLVLQEGIVIAGLGITVGLVGSLVATRVLSSLLYGVSATDPLTFALIAILLGATALLASYLPAHRATRVDPMIALRTE